MSVAPAHSPAMEAAMLGACLLSPKARRVLSTELDPTDFYVPCNRHAAEAIVELDRLGNSVDAATVANWLAEHKMLEPEGLKRLIALTVNVPATTSAGTYAAVVRDRALRRRLKAALASASEALDDLAREPGETMDVLAAETRRADLGTGPTCHEQNVDEFLRDELAYDWLVPGLLERGDRVVITSIEGGGKSTLLRQLAVQFAAGIHPFQAKGHFAPVKVFLCDLENSRQQVNRQMKRLIEQVRPSVQRSLGTEEDFKADNLVVNVRSQGINLLSRSDRRWFTERVESVGPQVVITGPIYKMHRSNPIDEEPAAQLAAYLDDLRMTYGFALLLEAHSPHGTDGGKQRTLRPYGASLWMRWPEFGYGMRQEKDGIYGWVAWRGPRDDEREWPKRLRRGRSWPWVNAYAGEAVDEQNDPRDPRF